MKAFFAVALLASAFTFSTYAQNIQGVRMLKLSEYSLAKMGIRISDNNVYFQELNKELKNGKVENKGRKIMLTKNSIKIKTSTKKEIEATPPFAPIFAVNIFKGGS
ncbi:MAG: hypothetical protein HYZ54_04945, partial [Ignavibacteriae bacterium]|nr:hypothetical protein [Ignavibacteriota bacterium]